MKPLITLTTDFGLRDPYVAAMKGIIKSLCRKAEIVDLTHDISPGSVLEGALSLATLSKTYGDVAIEEPLALIGSSNHLEIAVDQGNARDMLGLDRGETCGSRRLTGTLPQRRALIQSTTSCTNRSLSRSLNTSW